MKPEPWGKATWEQRAEILQATGLKFTATQLPVVRDDWRVKLVVGGERGGKSFTVSADALSRLPWGSIFWIIGADYAAPRAEFEYLAEHLTTLGAIANPKQDISMPKEGSWQLRTKSGQVIQTRTAADVRKLASKSVSGILLVEAGQMNYDVVPKALGRLSQERGWLTISGTFEGSTNWYAQLFNEWKEDPDNPEGGVVYQIPTWSNTFIFPGGRQDPEITRLEEAYSRVPGLFMERCGAVPSPAIGVIFRHFSLTRHISDDVQYNPYLPVYLGIDPAHGGASAYAIAAVQFYPDEWVEDMKRHGREGELFDPIDFAHVIDAIYMPGIAGNVEDIAPLLRAKPWWDRVEGGAIDPEAPDERKRWAALFGIHLWSKRVPVVEGERRLQSFINYQAVVPPGAPPSSVDPHLRLSTEVPQEAIDEFGKYRNPLTTLAEVDDKPTSSLGRRVGPDHFLKALWYLMVARYGYVKPGETFRTVTRPGIRSLLRNANYIHR